MVTTKWIAWMGMVVGLLATWSASAVTLSENGQAKAVIVIAADAPAPERHAAAELAGFLAQITGAQFPIAGEPNQANVNVFVGPQAAKVAQKDFSTDGLGDEGIVIRTVPNGLILAGGRPRGTLYAVYTFLEDHLGCRWWSSTESTIPSKATIVLNDIDVRYVPVLEYREPYWFDAFDGDWAVRNRANGNTARLDEARGGKHVYKGFVHTFYPLVPPEEHFAAHPEWYSEIGGVRRVEGGQLCTANPELTAFVIERVKQWLRETPEATIISVSQNDWGGRCECADCKALEEAEGSPSGPLLHFVNQVAEAIEPEFPHVAVDTLAYQYTRKPPKLVKPRPNVIVQLCSIECSFSKPLADERNKPFRDDIIGWSQICNRLYIWDYTTNFRHHIMPHPNLRVLGPNVKFFVDHNVKGIFEQGAYTTNGAEMAELRAWVLAKLLWDPSRSGDQLVEEFLEGYYGPAAPYMKKYLATVHDAVDQSGDWLGCFEKHTAKYLNFETLTKGRIYLLAAEEQVKDDPVLQFRVQVAQLPVMYTFMMRWTEMREAAKAANAEWPMPESIRSAYDRFLEIARKKNVTRLSEWQEGFGALDDALARAGQ